MLGKFFVCEVPKEGKYVKAIKVIRDYEDKRKFPMDEVVCADKKINILAEEKDDMGGINVADYRSILRWILRGDTLCDVTIPKDGKIYETVTFSTNGGTYRADKIILSNPRIIDDKLALELYKTSDLPWKSYLQVLSYISTQGFEKTCNAILTDKVNKENAEEALDIFENYLKIEKEQMTELYIDVLSRIKSLI